MSVAADIGKFSAPDQPISRPLASVAATATSTLTKALHTAAATLLGSSPSAPTPGPGLWVVLAAVRRELGTRLRHETVASAATTATVQGLDDPLARAAASAVTNSPPTATLAQSKPSATTGKVTGTVKAVDPDRDKLTYLGATTAKGTVTVTSKGAFTYTPTAAARHAAAAVNASASDKADAFAITVSDGQGHSIAVPITVSITPSNASPSTKATVAKAHPLTGLVQGSILDADGDTLILSTIAGPVSGAVSYSPDGSFTYTPTATARAAARAAGKIGTDKFTVAVDDGHGGVKTVAVNVTIAPTNTAPTPGSATVGQPNGTSGVVKATITATDQENDKLTFGGSGTTAKGKVAVTSSGAITFTPSAAARHAASAANATPADLWDTFTVTVTDRFGATATREITVAIVPRNGAPTSKASVGKPVSGTGQVTGALKAADPDKDSLTYTASAPSRGTVLLSPNGTFTYTPTAAARHAAADIGAAPGDKTDIFTITIDDGHGGQRTIAVNVTVAPTNSTPGQLAVTKSDPNNHTAEVSGQLAGFDSDGDPLLYTGPSKTAKGTVAITADGSFVYSPTVAARKAAGKVGAPASALTDSFTVTAADGFGGKTTTTVMVPILPADASTNFSPVSGPTVGATYYDEEQRWVRGSLGITDADADILTITLVRPPLHGSVGFINNDGSFLYQASAEAALNAYRGVVYPPDSFVATVSDGHNPPVTVTVTGIPILPAEAVQTARTQFAPVVTGGPSSRLTISPDGSRIYVVGLREVTTLNARDLTLAGKWNVNLPSNSTTVSPAGIAYTTYTTARYNPESGVFDEYGVYVQDAVTGQHITTIALTKGGSDITVQGNRAYVDTGDGFIVIDTTSNTVVGTAAKGAVPIDAHGVVYGTVRRYVTDEDKGFQIIDRRTGKTTLKLLMFAPLDVVLSPDGSKVYVVEFTGNVTQFTLAMLDKPGNANTPPPPITVRPAPQPASSTSVNTTVNLTSGYVSGTLSFNGGAQDVNKDGIPDPDPTVQWESGTTTGPLGTLEVNANGTYTFTPSQAARNYAAQSTKNLTVLLMVTVINADGQRVAMPLTVPLLPAGTPPNEPAPLTLRDFMKLPGALPNWLDPIYGFGPLVDYVAPTGPGVADADGKWLHVKMKWMRTKHYRLITDPRTGQKVEPDIYVLQMAHSPKIEGIDDRTSYVIGWRKLEVGETMVALEGYAQDGPYTDHYAVAFLPGTFPESRFKTRTLGRDGGYIFNNEIPAGLWDAWQPYMDGDIVSAQYKEEQLRRARTGYVISRVGANGKPILEVILSPEQFVAHPVKTVELINGVLHEVTDYSEIKDDYQALIEGSTKSPAPQIGFGSA